jgi:hypothetical protein
MHDACPAPLILFDLINCTNTTTNYNSQIRAWQI